MENGKWFLALLTAATVHAVELFRLDSGNAAWTVSNASYTSPASVPGCVHLDLLQAGLIGEPNYGYNQQLQRWIPSDNFTYTCTFSPPAAFAAAYQRLTLAGVDTDAMVLLNGHLLGTLENMHRTHVLSLPPGALLPGASNNLTFFFTGAVPASLARQRACEAASPPCSFGNCTCPQPWPGPAPDPLLINAYLRKEQQDFSWDFAPATGTAGLREPPLLWAFSSAALREGAVVSMTLLGDRLWDVNVTARVEGDYGGGVLSAVVGSVPGAAGSVVVAPPPPGHRGGGAEATVRLTFPDAPSIKRWWPRGYGDASLYPLSITFNSSFGEVSRHPPLRLGFRVIVLEQPPAPNGGFLFRLRVNGVVVHARGSNWVPPNSLPGRPTAGRELASLVLSAVWANHNILRVWGGGVYAPTQLMDAADEHGVLIFHDAQFGDQFYNTQKIFLDGVGAEIRDNLFRLGHHPSLAVLCGSNEMAAGYSDDHHLPPSAAPFYSALYFDTILSNFSSLLPFTPTVSSTPSNGNETRDHPWSASAEIVTRGDIHWYDLDGDCFNISNYPRPRWITEHGWESFPSFFTLAPTLTGPQDFSFNSSLVASRQQHPPGQAQITAMVERNWGWPPRSTSLRQRTARYARLSGRAARRAASSRSAAPPPLLPLLRGEGAAALNATAFRDELHMTQVAAGYCLRLALQRWRSFADDFSAQEGGGTAGILYWQLDEPWPGPSWATLELGGRRKVGHYFARWAFAPLLVAGALVDGEGLVVDASLTTYDPALLPPPGARGALKVRAFAWAGGALGTLKLKNISLPPPHATARVATFGDVPALLLRVGCPAPEQCLLSLSLSEESGGRLLAENHVLLTPPKTFVDSLPDPGVSIEAVVPAGVNTFNVTVACARPPAALVWMESPFAGAWSDNAMMLLESTALFIFSAVEPVGVAEFAASLAVSSLFDVYGKGG
jgi:beta-mannosidase